MPTNTSSSRSTTKTPTTSMRGCIADDRRGRHQPPAPCPVTAWAITSRPKPHRAADADRGKAAWRPVAGRQAADGLLPHESLQAAWKAAAMRSCNPFERHILRNYVFLHAIEDGLPLPIGTQDAGLLDARTTTRTPTTQVPTPNCSPRDEDDEDAQETRDARPARRSMPFERGRRRSIGSTLASTRRRFQMAPRRLVRRTAEEGFRERQRTAAQDAQRVRPMGPGEGHQAFSVRWMFVTQTHPNEKIIVFTQFADTVRYLERQLKRRGIAANCAVSGERRDPTRLRLAFQPREQQQAATQFSRTKNSASSSRRTCSAKARTCRTAQSSSITTCLGPSFGLSSVPAASTASARRPNKFSATPSCRPTASSA